jgi:hypothetical protein
MRVRGANASDAGLRRGRQVCSSDG